jgi:hypothetical protein
MRWLLGGVVLGVAGQSVPAWADCAGEIAAIEDELAATPAGGAGGAQEPASSPEEVVDQMIEEGVSIEEDGADTRFAAGGLAEPRERAGPRRTRPRSIRRWCIWRAPSSSSMPAIRRAARTRSPRRARP